MPHTEVSIIGKMMNLTQRFSRDRSWSENCTGVIIKIIMINIFPNFSR
jgi:hypothetical protein